MNWIEKIYYLKDLEAENTKNGYQGEYFIDINAHDPKWEAGELEELIKDYPWLPEEYIKFSKEFDRLSLSFCVFYGSKGGKGISLAEEIKYFKPIIGKDYFPFGKDADPSIYAIGKDGSVWFFDKADGYETKIKCADTFKQFVDSYLLGVSYPATKTRFYQTLKHLGWV